MFQPGQLPNQALSAEQRRLLALFGKLSAGDRQSLFAFAEFLAARGGEASEQSAGPVAPTRVPRPEGESVVAAMRRLSGVYPMLDKSLVLHEAASLMAAHTLQGRPAVEVIDELEGLFERAYQDYLETWQSS